MNVGELCPDDLLLAARQGELSALEDAKLAFHLQRCARCRTELEVGRAFDAVLGARAGDDEVAMRIAARLMERPRRRRWTYALAAGVLLTGSLAGAAVSGVDFSRWLPGTPPSERSEPAPKAALPAPPVVEQKVQAPLATPAAPPPAAPAPLRTPDPAPLSAAEIFREANLLRSQGKGGDAQRRYRELQARYPGSSEAKVSLVSLARLEVAAQPALALRHFDAYLASGHGTLSEEALFGRASALGRLGRSAEERAAWQLLLSRFPASVYAHQAEARLSRAP